MTGLVYKEWKQNRWFILSMILCGAAPLLALLLLHSEKSDIGEYQLRIGGMIAGFLAAGFLQIMVLRGDDRKLWSCWITSTADGYKGFLRVKYEMIFGMILLFLTSLQVFDMLFCAVETDMGITEVNDISGAAIPLIFVQILLRAADIPFFYRFGSKTGSIIKMICLVTAAIAFSVVVLLNTDRWENIMDSTRKVFSDYNSSLILSGTLVGILVLYCLSYHITCRVYLKGVEQYDK